MINNPLMDNIFERIDLNVLQLRERREIAEASIDPKYSNLEYSRRGDKMALIMADDDIVRRIGLNITIIRERRGLTQEKLAELASLHRAYIGQIERGEKNIGLRNLEKISKALDVSIRVLVDTSCVDG